MYWVPTEHPVLLKKSKDWMTQSETFYHLCKFAESFQDGEIFHSFWIKYFINLSQSSHQTFLKSWYSKYWQFLADLTFIEHQKLVNQLNNKIQTSQIDISNYIDYSPIDNNGYISSKNNTDYFDILHCALWCPCCEFLYFKYHKTIKLKY